MMVWIGPTKLRLRCTAPMRARYRRARRWPRISSRMPIACWRPCHSASERSRYFSVTISRIGPTSCAMPPCTSTRLSCSRSRVARRNFVAVEDRDARQQAAAADAEFRIALAGGDAFDQLDARPDAAGILPAAAGAAEPFAEDRARRHQAALVFLQRAGQRVDLAGGAHADGDQAGQQVGGNRQARAFGNVVDLADDLDAVARAPISRASRSASGCVGAFHARRHDAGGDHRGLQQPR